MCEQVMRTFGWTPTEGELQELIGEIDQVSLRLSDSLYQLISGPSGWEWLHHI